MAIHLDIGSLKTLLGWSWYRDANPVSTSPLADDITTAPSGPGFLNARTRKEGNVLFNDALNTFYLRLYGFRHMVKDHSDSKRGNPLPPHRLLSLIISKGSFICIIPQTG